MATEIRCSHLKRDFAPASVARLMAGVAISRAGRVVVAISTRSPADRRAHDVGGQRREQDSSKAEGVNVHAAEVQRSHNKSGGKHRGASMLLAQPKVRVVVNAPRELKASRLGPVGLCINPNPPPPCHPQ